LPGRRIGVSELHDQLIMFGGRDLSLSNEPGHFHSKHLSEAELQKGNRQKTPLCKTIHSGDSREMRPYRVWAGAELNLPAKSSDRGGTGWGMEYLKWLSVCCIQAPQLGCSSGTAATVVLAGGIVRFLPNINK
ncbi:hypothetical protein GOODEAATRI_023045, partial [Goodea atripinnis]